jgi:hypothetical protein
MIRRVNKLLHVFARAVTPHYTDKFLDIMAVHAQHRQALFVELRRAKLVHLLGDVVKLMLDQRAEFQISTLRAVVSGQCDDLARNGAKPFMHLLYHPCLLPSARTHHHLFGLAEYGAPLLRESLSGPHEFNVSVYQVRVVRVIHRAAWVDDLVLNPLEDLISGEHAGVKTKSSGGV